MSPYRLVRVALALDADLLALVAQRRWQHQLTGTWDPDPQREPLQVLAQLVLEQAAEQSQTKETP